MICWSCLVKKIMPPVCHFLKKVRNCLLLIFNYYGIHNIKITVFCTCRGSGLQFRAIIKWHSYTETRVWKVRFSFSSITNDLELLFWEECFIGVFSITLRSQFLTEQISSLSEVTYSTVLLWNYIHYIWVQLVCFLQGQDSSKVLKTFPIKFLNKNMCIFLKIQYSVGL